jgi:hypothetical protein
MADYSAERYNPSLAQCSALSLHFDGRTLVMKGGKKPYSYAAVSGRRRADGSFDYGKAAQKSPFSGPIPEGIFWIRPDELWERSWDRKLLYYVAFSEKKERAHEAGWGNYRLTIHPFTTTRSYQRGGFFIHGGKVPGSAGCIDLTRHMAAFVSDLKNENARRKCQIHLTVQYPKAAP